MMRLPFNGRQIIKFTVFWQSRLLAYDKMRKNEEISCEKRILVSDEPASLEKLIKKIA